MSIIISKKSIFLIEKLIFEILPLFFAIIVVIFPRLPGSFFKTTEILALDIVLLCIELSHEIFNYLSGLSENDDKVSQSIVCTATPIPAVTIPTIVSPLIGEQQPAK